MDRDQQRQRAFGAAIADDDLNIVETCMRRATALAGNERRREYYEQHGSKKAARRHRANYHRIIGSGLSGWVRNRLPPSTSNRL